MTDHIIDKSPLQKQMHGDKLRAELKSSLRQSVLSADVTRYFECGWQYVMPDFDRPLHSIIEWKSEKIPVYPTCVPTLKEAQERA